MDTYDTAVIGGGPAGMAAALGASNCGARVLLIERAPFLGGILNQCTHTGFGLTYFGEELTGPEYARRFAAKTGSAQIEILTDTTVMKISADGILTLSGARCGFMRITAKTVVLASGCREKPVGALAVAGTRPAGVFTAGAAQKLLNLGGYDIGSRAVILGSGDVGMIVARELMLRGKETVAVIEKKEKCGGLARNRINCLEKYKIPLMTSMTVSEVHGTGRVTGVTIENISGGDRKFIACDTLITSVGLIPERELLEDFCGNIQLPDFVFLCGNACFVHDTADDVSVESERIGRLAAQFADTGVISDLCANTSEDMMPVDGKRVICTACPKSCRAVQSDGIWHGLLCGRSTPVSGGVGYL